MSAYVKTILNKYVFSSIQGSLNHVSGWHAVDAMCKDIGEIVDKSRLTATKNRHRVSTLFAGLELPKTDQKMFYDHMGHSKNINKNIYQAPPALLEITRVGKHLAEIDEGILFYNY